MEYYQSLFNYKLLTRTIEIEIELGCQKHSTRAIKLKKNYMSNTGLTALVPTLLPSEFFSYLNPSSEWLSSHLSSSFIFTL